MEEHGQHWPLVKAFCLFVGFVLLPVQVEACRLALVLAMDVSSSVDDAEDALQRQGLANALLAQEVQSAFFSSPDPVALTIFEWSGQNRQTDIVPWTVIATPEDLIAVSDKVRGSEREYVDYPTALGQALSYASLLFRDAPNCLFKTIDVSGDGQNNDGFPPAPAYAVFPFDDVTVNALAIKTAGESEPVDLQYYYETEVIRGPGAFVEVAESFADFEMAMIRKLERELRALTIGWVGSLNQ